MPRDWTAVVPQLSNVQRLVHLAMRLDSVEADRLRTELVKARRRAYEDELSIQAGRVGCAGGRGRLSGGPTLTALNEMSQIDAESIINTYNYDLAIAIQSIGSEAPSANRATYARRLSEWESGRNQWKLPQIAQYTENSARNRAQADFYRNNGQFDGYAVLEPDKAVCPVCAGWIARGEVPLKEALSVLIPFHVNCPHEWHTYTNKIRRNECGDLWLGD